MKKIIIPTICLLLVCLILININKITNLIVNQVVQKEPIIIENISIYKKENILSYVKNTDTFIPYSYQDLLNIIFTTINNGWNNFTFYCKEEYTECVNDVTKISNDDITLTHINNFVHPYNSFTNIKMVIADSGEINLKINYLYNKEQIDKINDKVKELIKNLINEEMDEYDQIKIIHDYIINNTKYDIERNNENLSQYNSYIAIGPLFEGYATCNGYTDLMAIFLTELGFKNFKIATTPNELNSLSTGHVWNAVYFDNNWSHLDLTWDDPVSNDGKDYLYHTYFLIKSKELKEIDSGKVKLEEHKFNTYIYNELKSN